MKINEHQQINFPQTQKLTNIKIINLFLKNRYGEEFDSFNLHIPTFYITPQLKIYLNAKITLSITNFFNIYLLFTRNVFPN